MICQRDVEVAEGASPQEVLAAFAHHFENDTHHILFVAFLQSLYPPLEIDQTSTNWSEILAGDTAYNYDYEYDYEDLVNLCDHLGNVELGVGDIDSVTTSIVTDKKDSCPICLETMPQTGCEYVREIKTCRHRFCSCCIETWLSAHKTCPICKQECTTD
jgi:hypothetical protein